MSTNLVVKLGIQIIASSLTMTLGIWGGNCKVTAVEIPQYKEKVSNKITQNTSVDSKEKEADIEINIIGELLNEPVFSPFRQEGTVKVDQLIMLVVVVLIFPNLQLIIFKELKYYQEEVQLFMVLMQLGE